MTPKEFLKYMKGEGVPIPGIGHRIKSLKNPDLRVTGLMNYAAETSQLLHFLIMQELLKHLLHLRKKT